MSELKEVINYLEGQITVSEPTPDYTAHNNMIRRYVDILEKHEQQPQLNHDQQIVLDWLKEEKTKRPASVCLKAFGTLSVLFDEVDNRSINIDVAEATNSLTDNQQFQVLAAFAQWGQERSE